MFGSLTNQEEKAVREFCQTISQRFGGQAKEFLLYGSKARGTFHSESDIDVFVLMEEENYEIRDAIVDVAFDLLLKYEVLISPRVVDEKTYQQGVRWRTAFVKNLQRDGIPIE